MPKLNDYLSVGEAAEYLGVSKDTLRRWDRSVKLTARRHPVTGYRLYLKKDLDPVLNGVDDPGTQSKPTDRGTGRKRRR